MRRFVNGWVMPHMNAQANNYPGKDFVHNHYKLSLLARQC